MNLVKQVLTAWKQDNLLRKIVRNSGYLFIGNTLSTIVQSILSARLLGILGFGILGVVIEFATNINRLLSFRMGELVVKYMGQYLAEHRTDRASAIFKASIFLETVSSIIAYLLLLVLAPLAAAFIVKDTNAAELIKFYALALLTNFATESSSGFLQVTDRFRSQATIGLMQSLLTAGLIIYAFLVHGSIQMVLGAYLAGKVFNGLVLAGYSFWRARHTLGPGWWRASLKLLPPAKEFWRFAWSTNFSGTVTMVTRDSESVWLSFLLGPFSAGVYKTAKAVINLVTLPITPFITAAYPAMNKAVAEQALPRLRNLLKKLTWISAIWTGGVAIGLLLAGRWLITTFYGAEYIPAYPVLLILLIGFGFANIFYWNRTLLLSLGLPMYPLWIIAIAGAVKLGLTFLLVPRFGYLMEAALLSTFFVVSIGLIVIKGLRQIRNKGTVLVNERRNESDEDNFMDQTFQSSIRRVSESKTLSTSKPGKPSFLRSHVNYWDMLAFVSFILMGAWYCLARLEANYPTVILSGDGGNIASYAAAQDHPDWFISDPALGEANNTGIYATIHIPFIRFFQPVVGDYGLAYTLLVFPNTTLQLLGFYFLGRVLFKNRFWAYLLSFITAMVVINIGLGEIWGVWRDALPRVTFQALLPFLLACSLLWKGNPRYWPLLMGFSGLLVYVHPISAPAWGLAIWLGLWLCQPKIWTWKKRIIVMLGLGILFLVVMMPFVLNYLSYRNRDLLADYDTVMMVLLNYSPINLLNVPAAVGDFLRNATKSLLFPFAVIGFFITWLLKKKDRFDIKVVLMWSLGILISSILIPFIERIIESKLHIFPIETELMRGIRYFVPIFLIFWLWPLAEWTKRTKKSHFRLLLAVCGMALCIFWGIKNPPEVSAMLRVITCPIQGQLICKSNRSIDELILTLKTQSIPGEGVFVFNTDTTLITQSLSVRYAALRPLVYSPRDSGILSYSSRGSLDDWLAITRQVEEYRSITDPMERLSALIPLADNLGAEYLVVDFTLSPGILDKLPATVIMQNDDYLLMKLHE